MDINNYLDNFDLNQFDCEYVDIRIEKTNSSNIRFEYFILTESSNAPSLGAFIRVYEKSHWYYFSTTNFMTLVDDIHALIEKAKNSSMSEAIKKNKPYNTHPQKEVLQNFTENNFTQYPVDEKIKLLESYFGPLKREELKKVVANYTDLYKEKAFKSSTGVQYYFDLNHGGVRFAYTLLEGENRFDDNVKFSGYTLDALKGHQEELTRQIEQSLPFLQAKTIQTGSYPVVMDPEVVGVFAHESFGHKSEADFMLGDENAKSAWKIGTKVGSDKLSIVDYGAEVGTSGYCPIDDEGFPTQKTYLIKDGILQGRLHNMETAHEFDEAPTGNARSINFEYEPIVRMTNTYVEPGEKTFAELIAQVDEGIYVTGVKHGSGLSTFTIAPIKCYMIRKGQIAEPVKVSVISGDVFKTLALIEDCSREFQQEVSVFGGCGKMEQWPLPVGMGGANVLISKMMVS